MCVCLCYSVGKVRATQNGLKNVHIGNDIVNSLHHGISICIALDLHSHGVGKKSQPERWPWLCELFYVKPTSSKDAQEQGVCLWFWYSGAAKMAWGALCLVLCLIRHVGSLFFLTFS